MYSKKGVSPLIATVLLISFAVALATVIVNLPIFGPCANLNLIVRDEPPIPPVCFEENHNRINLLVANNGKYNIMGFKASIIGSRKVENTNIQFDLPSHAQEKLVLPFNEENESGTPTEVTLWPVLNRSGESFPCEGDAGRIRMSPIPLC
jgi:flagellin-like protein